MKDFGNKIFGLTLSLSATSWMMVLFGIKEKWSIGPFSRWMVGVGLLLIPVILSKISLYFAQGLDRDTLTGCDEITLADNEFTPVYLGYFFAALSVSDFITMTFVFGIVTVFVVLLRAQYYNPVYLMFGYHYYHITTKKGTKIFAILRGDVIRKSQRADMGNLIRINDSTFMEVEGENNDTAGVCKDKRTGEEQ